MTDQTPSTPAEHRLVHLGIGNFARAHTLVYTAADPAWRVVAFTGRSARMAQTLTAQDGRYGLIVRGADGDDVSVIAVLEALEEFAGDAGDVNGVGGWFEQHVDIISTMVDRITPTASPADAQVVRDQTALVDATPVVTEPFHEWVVEDRFRGARPAWEKAGAQLVDDVEIHERRKLPLLNGAHTYLAYAGQLAGHERVDQAIADPTLRDGVEALWAEARATLPLPEQELTEYTSALVERFANPRLADQLLRIAADGSAKLRVRTLPVIAEAGGPEAAPGEVAVVAAWTAWVTQRVRAGGEVSDPQADAIAAAVKDAGQDDAARVRALVGLTGGEELGLDLDELARAVHAAE
ncbi:mannitol dehydrogenase family protein [Brachybacterium sp. EF45031]|uniref:mannitol dehydrogenase family protein n=1 Tax=Brachybacterium sillae TaxID=2810536 RepID=UPI00217EEC7E|nr:mannitol dehydrogenase family protein [Brachybacterium sillae]MCS6711898.1 mannitol dehydrogenase family protein [Brachybacterium sillae]